MVLPGPPAELTGSPSLRQEGASHIFPDYWDAYVNHIPPVPCRLVAAICVKVVQAERGDLITAYHKRLTSDDPAVQLAAAKVRAMMLHIVVVHDVAGVAVRRRLRNRDTDLEHVGAGYQQAVCGSQVHCRGR